MTSNHLQILPMEKGDRHYLPVSCDGRYTGHAQYFVDLWNLWRTPGVADDMYTYFLSQEFEELEVKNLGANLPQSEIRVELQARMRNKVEVFIDAIFVDQSVGIDLRHLHRVDNGRRDPQGGMIWDIFIALDNIYAMFVMWYNENYAGEVNKWPRNKFSGAFTRPAIDLNPYVLALKDKRISGKARTTIFIIRPEFYDKVFVEIERSLRTEPLIRPATKDRPAIDHLSEILNRTDGSKVE